MQSFRQKPLTVLKQHHWVKSSMTTSEALMDLQRVSVCARLHCYSADVLCHCIIYCPLCRPLRAHPFLAVQVRVQLFALTHHWEGSKTRLHSRRPHMWQMQLEENMQLPQSPLSHAARQGQFVNEAPGGISQAWIGTCRYYCPCLLLRSWAMVLDGWKPLGGLAEEDVWPMKRCRVQ